MSLNPRTLPRIMGVYVSKINATAHRKELRELYPDRRVLFSVLPRTVRASHALINVYAVVATMRRSNAAPKIPLDAADPGA
jgi:hypothetical protein